MQNRPNRKESRKSNIAIVLAFLLTLVVASHANAQSETELINEGLAQHQASKYDQAIATFERCIQLYPKGSQRNKAELFAGHSYMLRNKYPTLEDANAAQNHFNYILNQGSRAEYYKEASFHTAHLAYEMRNYSNARTLFQKFIQEYPKDGYVPFSYYYLANCETQLGNPEQAIKNYEQALDNEYLKNSELRWNCQLERASLIGKLGDYRTADAELANLQTQNKLPADIACQVAVQRALLQFVQRNYSAAIPLLEDYIKSYSSDPNASDSILTAYLYEAYAYYALKDYNRAIDIIEQRFERNNTTLPPEAALLKIRLLMSVNRKDEAIDLLNNVAASTYGRQNPDVVTSYCAFVDLMVGNYDRAINELTKMLGVTKTGYNSTARYNDARDGSNDYRYDVDSGRSNYNETPYYTDSNVNGTSFANGGETYRSYYDSTGSNFNVKIDYFGKTGGANLDPLDCVEACKTLVLAYASRYATNGAREDYDYQDAIYRETVNYANWAKDPTITLLVSSIDQRRQSALKTPVAKSNDPYYVVAPYAYNGYSSTPGKFYNPTSYKDYTRPDYYMYGSDNRHVRPYDYYPESGNRYSSNDPNGYDSGSNYPNGKRDESAKRPSLPNNPDSNNSRPQNGQNANDDKKDAQTDKEPNNAENNGNESAGNAETSAEDVEEERHITPAEAEQALEKAETFYHNHEFERCNEVLLETLTSSETFWQDCPGVAPKIALLRGSALITLGKRSEAQMSYQDVINHAPNSPEATIAATYIGLNYDLLGRQEDAIKYLRRATAAGRVTPLSDAALYYLGMNERERGNIQNATQAFERLHRDFPSSSYWSHATWALAQIKADERDDKAAELLVNDALAKKPDAAIIDYLLLLKGEIALRAKDYEKALIAFDMIVDQFPDSALYSRARNRLAAIPAQYRNFEELDEEAFNDVPASKPNERSTDSAPKPNNAQNRPRIPASDSATELDPEDYRRRLLSSSSDNKSNNDNSNNEDALPKSDDASALPKATPLPIRGREPADSKDVKSSSRGKQTSSNSSGASKR